MAQKQGTGREVRVRTGSGSKGVRPGGANAIGPAYGSHITDGNRPETNYRGPKFHDGKSFQPVKFGNEIALNVGKGGPGTGREVMRCGSQAIHGPTVAGHPPSTNTPLMDGWPAKPRP